MLDARVALYAAIAIAVVLVAVFAGRGKTNDTTEHNYKALFIVGLSWIPIGLGTGNTTFWVLGTVFMLVGLANRRKWDRRGVYNPAWPGAVCRGAWRYV